MVRTLISRLRRNQENQEEKEVLRTVKQKQQMEGWKFVLLMKREIQPLNILR